MKNCFSHSFENMIFKEKNTICSKNGIFKSSKNVAVPTSLQPGDISNYKFG